MTALPKTPQELIAEGQALVRSIALKVHRSIPVRVDLEDLISYGQVGLAEAAKEFNPNAGAQFTTFAYYRIRGAIYDGLSQMSWLSRAQYRRLQFQQRASAVLQESHADGEGESSKHRDDRTWLQNTTEKLAIVYLAGGSDESGSGEESTWEDRSVPPATAAAAKELGARLHDLVDRLPEAEQRLIREIYFEDHTLQEASRRLGISKSWASRLHARSLEQLARWLRQMGAD